MKKVLTMKTEIAVTRKNIGRISGMMQKALRGKVRMEELLLKTSSIKDATRIARPSAGREPADPNGIIQGANFHEGEFKVAPNGDGLTIRCPDEDIPIHVGEKVRVTGREIFVSGRSGGTTCIRLFKLE